MQTIHLTRYVSQSLVLVFYTLELKCWLNHWQLTSRDIFIDILVLIDVVKNLMTMW